MKSNLYTTMVPAPGLVVGTPAPTASPCGRTLLVLRSNAGHYIGTLDEDGLPYNRESVEYFCNESAAKAALEQGQWTPRESVFS